MGAAKTIVRNALFSYGRTLIASALTLFSGRWILAELGASDYGVYGLVGGLLIFITFISGVLSQGATRYMAFATGEDSLSVSRWFNASANIYFCLPFLLAPVGLLIGEWLIRCVLKIPDGRLVASLWLLRFSVISLMGVLISMPYQSLLTAKQHIHVVAMIMLCQSVGTFVIALALPYCPGDHLVMYGALMAISFLGMQTAFVVVCRKICPECRIRREYWWDRSRIRKLATFSGWLFLGAFGMLVKGQGLSILVNWMNGTVANAGYSIGNQLGAQTETLYSAFVMAVNPELARREGANSHEAMLHAAKRASKLGMMIILMVGIPLFCECETVLKLWLGNPPPFAVFFTRIQIVSAIIFKMRIGQMMCFQAVGKVKAQQIIDFIFHSVAVVLATLVSWWTGSMLWGFVAMTAFYGLYLLVYVYAGSRTYEWPVLEHLKQIVLPCLAIFVGGVALFYGGRDYLAVSGLWRVFVTTFVQCGFVLIAFFLLVFGCEERMVLKNLLSKFPVRNRK